MPDRALYFISGLPRSGSTLLCNVLAQNPRFHATATSGILDVLFSVRNHWNDQIEFRAMPECERVDALLRVQRGMINGYFANIDQPVIFDKSRGWTAYIEMIEAILGKPATIFVPVRDLRGVLSSFEKLWRKSAATNQIGQERDNYFNWQTVVGRCETWMQPNQPVGLAYNRIVDAIQRGYRDRLHFIQYESLCRYPDGVLRLIYDILDEPYFEHDFEYIEQVTHEDDSVFGFSGLHTIRSKVEATPNDWDQILGRAAERYRGLEVW